MIHVIGITAINLHTKLGIPLARGKNNLSSTNPQLDLAGHGCLQAISAARCGAKVSLISALSSDLMGQHALNILRKEGIQTTGITTTQDHMPVTIDLNDPEKTTQIAGRKSNTPFFETQNNLPADHLNARNLIVLSNDIPLTPSFAQWLKTIKSNGAKIMLCLLPKNKETELISYADVIICDEQKTRLPNLNENSYLITTKNGGVSGASAQKRGLISHSINKKSPPQIKKTATFDIFCGYFAACLQAGQPLESMLNIACNAANLSAQSHGAYSTIPYLGYLEDLEKTSKNKSAA